MRMYWVVIYRQPPSQLLQRICHDMNQWINVQFCGWLSLNQLYTNRYHHTLFYYSIYLSLHIWAVLSNVFCENGRMVIPSGWILDNLNTQIQQGWPSQKLLN